MEIGAALATGGAHTPPVAFLRQHRREPHASPTPPKTENTGAENGTAMDTDGAHTPPVAFLCQHRRQPHASPTPAGNGKQWRRKRSGDEYRRSPHSTGTVFMSAPTGTARVSCHRRKQKTLARKAERLWLPMESTLRRYRFYASTGWSRTHLLHPPKTENIGAESGAAMDTDGSHTPLVSFLRQLRWEPHASPALAESRKHWRENRSGENYCAYDGIILQKRIAPYGMSSRHLAHGEPDTPPRIVFMSAPVGAAHVSCTRPKQKTLARKSGRRLILTEPTVRPYRFYLSTGGNRAHLLSPPKAENIGAEIEAAEIIALTTELYCRGELLLWYLAGTSPLMEASRIFRAFKQILNIMRTQA